MEDFLLSGAKETRTRDLLRDRYEDSFIYRLKSGNMWTPYIFRTEMKRWQIFIWFLNKKSPCYQIIYYRNGRRTSISTRTSNRKKAEKYLASFNPKQVKLTKRKKKSIRLSRFITEYQLYVGMTYSEN
jgi:hypothetical protein